MITMNYDDHGLSLNLAQAPKVTSLQLQKWMTLFVAHLHSAVIKNIGDGGLIGRRTGNLARAMKNRVIMTSDKIVKGEIWPDPDQAIYGGIQEDGGTILPKRSQFLTIPLAAMLTGNGVARGSARDVISNPEEFGFSGTFTRHGIIFGKTGRNSIIPLFALKTSVVLPGRHYMEITLRQELSWGLDQLTKITGEITTLTFGGNA